MTRLYDSIMRGGYYEPESRFYLAQSHVIVADNIAEYFYDGTEQTIWKLAEDFPNLAPPLEFMFFDFVAPAFSREKGVRKSWADTSFRRWGVLVHGHECDDADGTAAHFMHKYHLIEQPTWVLACGVFLENRSGNIAEVVNFFLPVDQHGSVCARPDGQKGVVGLLTSSAEENIRRSLGVNELSHEHVSAFYQLFACACLTISFMHCKNVTQNLVVPPDDRKAKAVRRGVPPPVRYHVLDIEPMKTVLRTEGQIEKTGLKKALHICRGHFATYDEKPLFGKVRGTFWKPSHVRGSLSEGAVVKDYRVHEPKPKKDGDA